MTLFATLALTLAAGGTVPPAEAAACLRPSRAGIQTRRSAA
jgi:hypothetical protein